MYVFHCPIVIVVPFPAIYHVLSLWELQSGCRQGNKPLTSYAIRGPLLIEILPVLLILHTYLNNPIEQESLCYHHLQAVASKNIFFCWQWVYLCLHTLVYVLVTLKLPHALKFPLILDIMTNGVAHFLLSTSDITQLRAFVGLINYVLWQIYSTGSYSDTHGSLVQADEDQYS